MKMVVQLVPPVVPEGLTVQDVMKQPSELHSVLDHMLPDLAWAEADIPAESTVSPSTIFFASIINATLLNRSQRRLQEKFIEILFRINKIRKIEKDLFFKIKFPCLNCLLSLKISCREN
jgi:hypothetical protein